MKITPEYNSLIVMSSSLQDTFDMLSITPLKRAGTHSQSQASKRTTKQNKQSMKRASKQVSEQTIIQNDENALHGK